MTLRQRSRFRAVLLVAALVAVATLSTAPTAAAAAGSSSGGASVGDHRHALFAVDVCGEWLPPAPTFETSAGRPTSRAGIHTHGDGLIHIHPFIAAEAGANATLGRYLTYGGWSVTPQRLRLWTGPAAAPTKTAWANGDACPTGQYAGQPGRVVWSVDGKVQRGAPSRLQLEDGQIVVAGFLPEGVELPVPAGASQSVRQPRDVTGATKQLSAPAMTIDPKAQYVATVKTNLGDIVIDLDAAHAPIAVNNFVSLADQKFFDATTIHRAVRNFVIQGGDRNGDGSGDPGYQVAGEVPQPAVGQPAYPIGSVAMAKTATAKPGTSGSQFFVVTGAAGEKLPADYARIGTVSSGLDVAQRIAGLAPSSGDGPPTLPVFVYSVTVAER